MRFNNLDAWLTWQESLNPKEIDLGLDRVNRVLLQAGLSNTFNCPLITVAGTNGKGSVVAMLESLAKTAGLKVCSYTSPHIFQYNERIKINALPVPDTDLCEVFERIDKARGNEPLTYFEFGTLAAIDLFFKAQPDLVILEVGLGGRLDAVNVMDADVSIITSIAIDHVDWLGDNRELIAYEKAGIFRAGKAVVCGDRNPPKNIITEAEKKKCELLLVGRDFDVRNKNKYNENKHWQLKSSYDEITNLPVPNLTGEFQKTNAATAIVALQLLQEKNQLSANIDFANIASTALSQINLPGRFQKINQQPPVFVDVAHNPQAALALSSQLKLINSGEGKCWAIVAMLADKDVTGVLEKISGDIDGLCFAGLESIARGLSAQALFETLSSSFFEASKLAKKIEITEKNRHDLKSNQCTMLSETVLLASNVEKACDGVLSKMKENDRLIIFGSFYTVADAIRYFSDPNEDI
ncbi:Dihydrofolate synthase @ Folylpolyglutamate synthase [hydrothermal vent metagenome]|uniref:Dihydrofolate synthase @ Folylpolyglutamate synthase n=1 Tax=hydrothermal vent metagenome TaxID=652676 RepID=A0A3B0W5R4_9ZZZZ